MVIRKYPVLYYSIFMSFPNHKDTFLCIYLKKSEGMQDDFLF